MADSGGLHVEPIGIYSRLRLRKHNNSTFRIDYLHIFTTKSIGKKLNEKRNIEMDRPSRNDHRRQAVGYPFSTPTPRPTTFGKEKSILRAVSPAGKLAMLVIHNALRRMTTDELGYETQPTEGARHQEDASSMISRSPIVFKPVLALLSLITISRVIKHLSELEHFTLHFFATLHPVRLVV